MEVFMFPMHAVVLSLPGSMVDGPDGADAREAVVAVLSRVLAQILLHRAVEQVVQGLRLWPVILRLVR